MVACFLLALGTGVIDPWMTPQFSARQVAQVKSFWADPSRFRADDQLAQGSGGPYIAAATAEGSTWLHAYYKAVYPGQHILPDRDMVPLTAAQKQADSWLERRIEADWAAATQEALALNEGRRPPARPTAEPPPFSSPWGPVPSFAGPHRAKRYTVLFPECAVFAQDAAKVRRKFPYLRCVDGVDILGSTTAGLTWQNALRKSKASPQACRVLQAVADLEGAFDSVNTYDTGRLSVGIVQFATMAGGQGSLGEMLLAYKRSDRDSFQQTFPKFGVDVTPLGVLTVVDPATGWEFQGPAAVRRVQSDPRLAAVFCRAGRLSEGYQAVQVKMALALFWPGEKSVGWTVANRNYSARLVDIFRSDAGMATLFDRSVNTGDLSPVLATVREAASRIGAKSAADLAAQESRLMQALRYRKDFTVVAGLSRPAELYASSTPGPMQGSVLPPATPEAWRPTGKPTKPEAAKEPEQKLPEGADPRYAVPLGPPAEERKPEDFESPLKKKPNEKAPSQAGG
ncbi:MAG: hypothetical protein JSS65_05730 [Armatimonadetes bacterium]|nr:hypothetical protein [Armatimonadota bacterium]